jgi:hypothetical protein
MVDRREEKEEGEPQRKQRKVKRKTDAGSRDLSEL